MLRNETFFDCKRTTRYFTGVEYDTDKPPKFSGKPPVLLAEKDPAVVAEMSQALGSTFHILTLDDFPGKKPPKVDLDGETYFENAEKIALAFYHVYKCPILSEDWGLEITSLAGLPGIQSRTFGGANLSWPERLAMLLNRLGSSDRKAICKIGLCYLHDPMDSYFFQAELSGKVVLDTKARSYEGIFEGDLLGKVLSAATIKERQQAGFRALAAQRFLDWWKNNPLS